MSTRIASLYADLGIKDQMTPKLKGAKGELGAFKNEVGSAVNSMAGFNVVGLGAAGAVLGIGTALAKSLTNWQKYTIEVGDFAAKLGTTTEEASALREMAGDLDLSLGSLEMAFKTMAREDIPPSIEGLIQVKARLDGAKDSAEKMALAQKLLGKAGADLIPVFAQLTDQELRDYVNLLGDGQKVTKAEYDNALRLRGAIEQVADAYDNAKLAVGGYIAEGIVKEMDANDRARANEEARAQALREMTEQHIPLNIAAVNARTAQILRSAAADEQETRRMMGSAAAAGGLSNAIEDLTANQYLEAAAVEYMKNGNSQLYLDTMRLYNAAKAHNNELQRTLTLLGGLTSHEWNIETNMSLGRNQFLGGGGGGGGGGGSVSGPPRLMGNTQADRDAYNAAYRAWVNAPKARGGPLDMVNLVGEEGPELIINGVVIPAAETRKLMSLGLTPGKKFGMGGLVESGGLAPSQYTADEYLRALTYAAGAGDYLGTGGVRVTGGGYGGGFGTYGATHPSASAGGGAATTAAASAGASAAAAVMAVAPTVAAGVASSVPAAVAQMAAVQTRAIAEGNNNLARVFTRELRALKQELGRSVAAAVQKVQ